MPYCIRCYKEKNILEMKSPKICIICANKKKSHYDKNSADIKLQQKLYYEKNREGILLKCKNNYDKCAKAFYNKKYYAENKDKIIQSVHTYYDDNVDKICKQKKKYRQNNKETVSIANKKYRAQRRKNDPAYKLRADISKSIYNALKINNGSKLNKSIMDYLPYTMQKLKDHLESQFEPWMTWDNWKRYDPQTWDDNDPSTWAWHIDHIIPQSHLSYSNMSDDNFQKCWALENLRPLSAKQNIKDGQRK